MFNDDIDETKCVWCDERISGTPFSAPGGEPCCSPQCVTKWFLGPYEASADYRAFHGIPEYVTAEGELVTAAVSR